MDFKQRIPFLDDEHKKLIDFLDTNKIKYDKGEDSSIVVLEILESNQFWLEIKKYITKHNIY